MGGFVYGYEDIFTIALAILGFLIVLMAQAKVNNAYKTYRKITSKQGLTGFEVARKILDSNGLSNVHIVEIKGELTDHYDPSRRVIKLSPSIFRENTVAAVAVAAHECGHAIQDKDGYTFMKIRSALVPVVNFVSYIGYFVMFISLLNLTFLYLPYVPLTFT